MYLDTDITMALIGLDDFLLEKLEPDMFENSKTSVITIFEIHDILKEMDTDLNIHNIYRMIKEKNIELLPLTPEILEISFKLLDKYNDLILFDSKHAIHAAYCVDLEETILSTDSLFKKIGEIKFKNPKKYENPDDFFLMCEE